MSALQFLLLEDNPLDAEVVQITLAEGGIDCELLRVDTGADFVRTLETDAFDLILADYSLPSFNGITALEIAGNLRPDIPFIIVSASLGEELAIEMLKRGATDYILKQRLGRLVPSVQRALREAQERRDRQQTELMLVEQKRLLELIASGQPLEECLRAACASMSKLNPRLRACFLLTDAQRRSFPRSITPDFPPSFGQGLKDAPINHLCIGTCGEAVYCGLSVTCADIANDDRWSPGWRDLCVAHGILACHSKPVLGLEGLPFGSLMLCFEEARLPTAWEHQLAEFGAQVASIVFERDRSNLALRQSEAKYHTLFKSIDEGFCICEMLFDENGESTDYRFLEVNPAFEKLTGLKQATGKTARELVPNLEAFWVEVYGKVAQTGEPIRFEQQSVAMNRWFDVNAFCIGEPQSHQFAILFTNITERKQAQQQIQQTLRTLETLIASSPLPIVVIEPDCRVQLWNPAAERLFGWSAAEVLGKPNPIVPPEKQEECRRLREAVINGEIFSGIETYRCDRDGSKVIVSISAALLDDNHEIVLLFQDITERQQAEEALRLNQAQLQTLFDAAPLGIYLIDGDFRIRQVNPTALPVFGDIPDLIGRDLDEVIHILWSPVYADEVVERFRHTLETGEPYLISEQIEKRRDRGVIEYYEWQINRIPLPEGRYGVVCYFRDISVQVLARQAIAASEKRLRSFVEANVVGILFGDIYGGIHEANDELLRIVGYTREDLQAGKLRWTDITPPEYLPLDAQHIAEAKARGACSPYEKEYIRKDGSQVPVLLGYSLVGEAREESVVFILDLSDRKQAEAALSQSEARFRLMVESAKEYAIFTLDLDGIVTSWNSGAERLLGYQEAEILGSNGRIIFTPEDNEREQVEWEMQTALTQGRAENERWHIRKDGSRFWASGLVMPLQTEAGNMQGFVKIMQDKTKQRQADERFRLLYDTTSNLLATEQPMTLMHNLFSKLSAQLELHCYFNYMVEEKDNQPMLHLRNYEGLSDQEAQSIAWIEWGQYLCGLVAQEQRQIVLNRGQIVTHPHAKLVCSMGITAYAGQPLIVQGRLLGTLSFASRTRTHFTPEEVALLQSACEQMAIAIERTNLIASIQQQAEQLQQANRIKDEFLAVLSHELRSPLNPILGWTRLLQSGKLDAVRQAEALATIERNARLQSQLIEDLLDISRIMQGKLTLTATPVSLTFVISAALETVRLAAEAKHIQLQLDLDTAIAPVSGDAARLQQVMWNLLTNAVKFTPNGGQVTVELRQLDQLAQIRVMDTGKGINPQFLPHVFEYFRQEDGSTTRKFGGLGLGLAIVRQIVEMHGGTVKAESLGENQGATFIVQLPVNPQPMLCTIEPTRPSVGTEAPLDNLQILVVDDDTDTLEFQAFLLEQNGAKVTAVASGLEALQVLDRFIPDVLVSDVGMADMDGYVLIQQIRSRPAERGGTIPAIALTAYAAEADQQKALEAGFQAHIAKPVERERVVEAILTLREFHRV